MVSNLTPSEIVSKMMENDAFSQWLGIKVIAVSLDCVTLEMTIRQTMVNGLSIAHGGITYAFGDSCMAFSANSGGHKRVSIETSISHKLPLKVDDVISATSKLTAQNNKTKSYEVLITNSEKKVVAIFKGEAYNTRKIW